jgi:hypothetical protein
MAWRLSIFQFYKTEMEVAYDTQRHLAALQGALNVSVLFNLFLRSLLPQRLSWNLLCAGSIVSLHCYGVSEEACSTEALGSEYCEEERCITRTEGAIFALAIDAEEEGSDGARMHGQEFLVLFALGGGGHQL